MTASNYRMAVSALREAVAHLAIAATALAGDKHESAADELMGRTAELLKGVQERRTA